MGHVVLNVGGELHGVSVPITQSACEAIRFKFNPSGLLDVGRLKALAAAFISECQRLQDDPNGYGGRELAVAITNMQTASMWAVLGATKGI